MFKSISASFDLTWFKQNGYELTDLHDEIKKLGIDSTTVNGEDCTITCNRFEQLQNIYEKFSKHKLDNVSVKNNVGRGFNNFEELRFDENVWMFLKKCNQIEKVAEKHFVELETFEESKGVLIVIISPKPDVIQGQMNASENCFLMSQYLQSLHYSVLNNVTIEVFNVNHLPNNQDIEHLNKKFPKVFINITDKNSIQIIGKLQDCLDAKIYIKSQFGALVRSKRNVSNGKQSEKVSKNLNWLGFAGNGNNQDDDVDLLMSTMEKTKINKSHEIAQPVSIEPIPELFEANKKFEIKEETKTDNDDNLSKNIEDEPTGNFKQLLNLKIHPWKAFGGDINPKNNNTGNKIRDIGVDQADVYQTSNNNFFQGHQRPHNDKKDDKRDDYHRFSYATANDNYTKYINDEHNRNKKRDVTRKLHATCYMPIHDNRVYEPIHDRIAAAAADNDDSASFDDIYDDVSARYDEIGDDNLYVKPDNILKIRNHDDNKNIDEFNARIVTKKTSYFYNNELADEEKRHDDDRDDDGADNLGNEDDKGNDDKAPKIDSSKNNTRDANAHQTIYDDIDDDDDYCKRIYDEVVDDDDDKDGGLNNATNHKNGLDNNGYDKDNTKVRTKKNFLLNIKDMMKIKDNKNPESRETVNSAQKQDVEASTSPELRNDNTTNMNNNNPATSLEHTKHRVSEIGANCLIYADCEPIKLPTDTASGYAKIVKKPKFSHLLAQKIVFRKQRLPKGPGDSFYGEDVDSSENSEKKVENVSSNPNRLAFESDSD